MAVPSNLFWEWIIFFVFSIYKLQLFIHISIINILPFSTPNNISRLCVFNSSSFPFTKCLYLLVQSKVCPRAEWLSSKRPTGHFLFCFTIFSILTSLR